MSASKFIAELERRKFLSDRLMAKLQESLAATRSPLSAEKLAAFLVTKKHLTQSQANDVLAGLTQSGVNLLQEDPEHRAGGSSIFEPNVPSRSKPPVEEEIRLAPIEDENEGDDSPRKRKSGTSASQEEDLPVLGADTPIIKLIDADDDGADGDASRGGSKMPDLTEASPKPRRTSSLSRGKKGASKAAKKKPKSVKGGKKWDSPLILMGGGAIVILGIVGGVIAFLLLWQSGNQQLENARNAMNQGAYPEAVQLFNDFLTSSPNHPEHSHARVQLALLMIRQPMEGGDFETALNSVETEVKKVEDEPAFKEEQSELAALVPQIAEGLAKKAEKASPTSEDSSKYIDLTKKSLEMCNNVAYIPKDLRDEAKLTDIRDTLERIERRQTSQRALADGLKAMDDAVAAGKPMDAYGAHLKLLKEHPELAEEKLLVEALAKTGAAEQAAIKFVDEKQPAETAERPTPWVAALAVASHRGGAAPATGTACVRIDGAVYGLDAASGKLLWRRFIGFGSTGWPSVVDHDVLVADSVRHELMRLEAATGKLVWRQTFKEPFSEPLYVGDRAYVAGESGKLYVVDLKTGARSGYLQLPQPVKVAPALDRLKTHLYIAGNQASLYAISLADMKCLGVYFLGHAPGAISVSPVVAVDKLAVVENTGAETSRLRLLGVNDKYVITKQQAERRLNGSPNSPPLTTGRGLIAVTDRGQIEVYDIAAGNEGETLTLLATRDAASNQPLMRHVAVVGRNIWVADTQLTKYNIIPTGNRLPVEEIQNNYVGSTFDHPLAAFGETLIELHRPKGRSGAVVAAIDTKQGRMLWETDLATPPAGAPVVDPAGKSLVASNTAGYTFRFDETSIKSRVQDQPLAAPLAPPQRSTLTASTDLGQGRAVFSAPNSDWLVVFNPAQADAVKWIHLDSPLASQPTMVANGFVVPLKIGQVFYLNSADGERLAAPFQPRIEPGASVDYQPAGVAANNQFVISDGKKIYLVGVTEQPQPHLEAVKEAEVGPKPIGSALVVSGDMAAGVAGDTRLARFKLPSLEPGGEATLPAKAEWGPYLVGDSVLVATADQKLLAVSATGEVRWQEPLDHGQLAGAPLVTGDAVVLTYRKGIVERRALADGKPLGTLNVEQPLASAAVGFMQRLVVTAADGTILVIDQPK